MEKWAEKLNIPLPECSKCGVCCLCATPSVSYRELLERAAKGDKFARDFFTIFVPYKNLEAARKISEDIVDKTVESCRKGTNNIPVEELVFYHCRHYHFEKKCLIYEDRPQLCRDFPGSPFTMMNKECAFYEWGKKCKIKYKELNKEIEDLKKYQKELENMREQKRLEDLHHRLKTLTDEEYRYILTLPSLCVVSPGSSWIKLY